MSRVKAVVAFLLMALALGGAVAWKPTQHLADQRAKVDLESMFPRSFGEWTVDDRMPVQLVSPDTVAVLNKIYNQTISRTYVTNTGQRIMLSVAYGGDQSDATRAHQPEVCYPAQGFQVISSSIGQLSNSIQPIRVKRLVARQGSRNEPITYWIIVGDKVTITGTEQKLAQLSYSVNGIIPDGMLIRVSSIDSDNERAFLIQQEFVNDLAAALQPAVRAQVLGKAST